MTEPQIAYWNMRVADNSQKEVARHNLVTEQQTDRDLTERERHNRAGESLDLSKLYETSRHNLETEALGRNQLSETTRHNQAVEGIDLSKLYEQQRSNLANEKLNAQRNSIASQANAIQAQKNAWDYEVGLGGVQAQLKRAEGSLLSGQAAQARAENEAAFNAWKTNFEENRLNWSKFVDANTMARLNQQANTAYAQYLETVRSNKAAEQYRANRLFVDTMLGIINNLNRTITAGAGAVASALGG